MSFTAAFSRREIVLRAVAMVALLVTGIFIWTATTGILARIVGPVLVGSGIAIPLDTLHVAIKTREVVAE